jgi:hypothetical protein
MYGSERGGRLDSDIENDANDTDDTNEDADADKRPPPH